MEEPLAVKIARLEAEIQALEVRENDGETGLGERITEKQKTLNIYLKSQQGKFASPISVALSHSYR